MTGILLVTFGFAGCSSEETLPDTESDVRVALQVTSGIQTRAVDNRWQKGDAIGIYMLEGVNPDSYYSNVKYATADNGVNGTFTPAEAENTIYLPDDNSERDFIAYYPWTDQITENIYPIDLADQSSQENIDFMVAAKATGINLSNNTVPFVFTHKLSKIEMEIKAGANISDTELKGLVVSLTNQPTTGTFNLLTSKEVAATSNEEKSITLLTAAEGKKAEAIVFPNANFNGMDFIFETKTIGNYSCPIPNKSASKFEPGKKYKYTITIQQTAVEVTSTITDWEDGGSTEGSATIQ